LFFGFIRDYKGLDILLSAMTDDRIKKRGIVLIVAGEFYCDSIDYTNFIIDNNLQDFVIMRTDFIPDGEVNRYFSVCDVVVQPYKSATQSGVTQIAYHFNKPMIITNVGGLEEFVPDGKVGLVVNPDPAEVANAIIKFYDDDLSIEFCRNIESEKLRFSWNNFLNNIENLHSRIAHK
jgi:glycosyltransferase involved in cell wall biosynthesis